MNGVFHDTAVATLFSAAKMNKVSLLEPGQEQRPHHHAGNDKVYYALTGTCRVTDRPRSTPWQNPRILMLSNATCVTRWRLSGKFP